MGQPAAAAPQRRLREPTTTITDLALAIIGAWLALSLVLRPHESATHLWAEALGCAAGGAFFGAIAHGLTDYMSKGMHRVFWTGAVLCSGVAAIGFAVAAGIAAAPAYEGWFAGIALIAAAIYVVAVVIRPIFGIAAMVSVVALAAILLSAAAISRFSPRAATWLVAAVALTAVGFGLQQARVSLHRHLNNNDLFHLLQLGSFLCLYQAAILLT
jgi:hypothetical protein